MSGLRIQVLDWLDENAVDREVTSNEIAEALGEKVVTVSNHLLASYRRGQIRRTETEVRGSLRSAVTYSSIHSNLGSVISPEEMKRYQEERAALKRKYRREAKLEQISGGAGGSLDLSKVLASNPKAVSLRVRYTVELPGGVSLFVSKEEYESIERALADLPNSVE